MNTQPALSRPAKRLILALITALMLSLIALINQRYPSLTGQNQPLRPGYYPVTQFIDGDTIAVDMNGKTETIRFIGVDTPEIHHPEKPVQCFGYAAADFTRQLIGAHPVRLESDPLSSNRDRYDRLLRYVYLPDGTLVDQKIIEQGFGFAYTAFEFSKSAEFKATEDVARSANRGLWASCPTD